MPPPVGRRIGDQGRASPTPTRSVHALTDRSQIVSSPRNVVLISFAGVILMPLFAFGATLKVGDRAPDFSLPDQSGKTVRLQDFHGKKSVVLAFYLRASTPG